VSESDQSQFIEPALVDIEGPKKRSIQGVEISQGSQGISSLFSSLLAAIYGKQIMMD
jgi:hypothetical protein